MGGISRIVSRLEYLIPRLALGAYQIVSSRPPFICAAWDPPAADPARHSCSTDTLMASNRPAGTSTCSEPSTRPVAEQVYSGGQAPSRTTMDANRSPGERSSNTARYGENSAGPTAARYA